MQVNSGLIYTLAIIVLLFSYGLSLFIVPATMIFISKLAALVAGICLLATKG